MFKLTPCARRLALACPLALASLGASASLTPSFDSFGPLAGATFGGSGIPNAAVAMVALSNDVGSPVTLGLTATQRYTNPALTNDGAGRFFAHAGVDSTTASGITGQLAQWNFGFYVGGSSSAALASFTYKLLFDVDAGAGEDFRTVTLTGAAQDSWNLGFNSFESFFGYTFNPNSAGEYSFKLQAFTRTGFMAGETSIVVEAGTRVERQIAMKPFRSVLQAGTRPH